MTDKKKIDTAEAENVTGGLAGFRYPKCPRCGGTSYALHIGFEVAKVDRSIPEQVYFQQWICELCIQPELAPYQRDGYHLVRYLDN